MRNQALAVLAGLVAWFVITALSGLVMRRAWPDYAAVVDAMTFTLPMMFGRLSIGAVATLTAGCVTALVARQSKLTALTTGLILLVLFVPQHIMLWAKFPFWYHLTFLLSLAPLAYLGGTIAAHSRGVGLSGTGPMMQAAERRSSGKPA
jgi:hypothetical protein